MRKYVIIPYDLAICVTLVYHEIGKFCTQRSTKLTTIRNVRLADAIIHISDADHVFVRLALSRDETNNKWLLRCLLIDVLPQDWLDTSDSVTMTSWLRDQRLFSCRDAFFYCGLLRSDDVQRWFQVPDDCEIRGFDHRPGWGSIIKRFALPELHDNVSTIRLPSHAQQGLKPIPFPSVLYTLQPKQSSTSLPHDDEELATEDGDYFLSFRQARAELIFGVTDRNQAYMRGDMIAVRVTDAHGWLQEVQVLPDKAVVTVGGVAFLGSHVVIEGDGLHNKTRVFSRYVTVPLPSQLPPEIHVVLLGGGTSLDTAYFYTQHPYAGIGVPFANNSPHVKVEREDVVGYRPPVVTPPTDIAVSAHIATDNPGPTNPKVFVSYSHDSQEHIKGVRELAKRLRTDGVECRLDRYERNPPRGWQKWMEDQIIWADHVLVVCTETYCRRFNGQETPGKGLGVAWEGMIITQALYEQAGGNDKFIPVVFSSEDAQHIPVSLRATTRYLVSEPEGYEKLYARLTGQEFEPVPPLGTIRPVKRSVE